MYFALIKTKTKTNSHRRTDKSVRVKSNSVCTTLNTTIYFALTFHAHINKWIKCDSFVTLRWIYLPPRSHFDVINVILTISITLKWLTHRMCTGRQLSATIQPISILVYIEIISIKINLLNALFAYRCHLSIKQHNASGFFLTTET